MKQDLIETIVGFIVLTIALLFFIFAYNSGNISKNKEGYIINANFDNVEGIVAGSDVTMSGIKIGYVESLQLDSTTFLAVLKLCIDKYIKLPKDSRAAIVSNGLLGGKLISINPGDSEETLNPNDKIKYTQSSINLESLIGKFIYSSSNNGANNTNITK